MKNAFESKVGAYSLAAGAVAVGLATVAQAAVVAGDETGMTVYDFSAAPIFVGAYASDGSEWISGNHDLLLLKNDGTVLTNPLDESLGDTPSTSFFSAGDKAGAIWFTLHNDLGKNGTDYAMVAHQEAWSGDGLSGNGYGAGTTYWTGEAVIEDGHVMAYVDYSVYGMLPENNFGYLGFVMGGLEGWAEVKVAGSRNEITLNKFAVVPEPATMGLLATGAAGLLARRKRK